LFLPSRLLAVAAWLRGKAAPADLFKHIRRWLPGFEIEVAFDVGANVGQTAALLTHAAPEALVYCFEPITASYEKLLAATEAQKNVRCFNVALGAAAGTAAMTSAGTKTSNRVINGHRPRQHEEVVMATGDGFCDEQKIEKISYLKIDTEGHDLDVLIGFRRMLETSRIDILDIEAGMNPRNTWHVPLEKLKAYLEPLDYLLYRLYEQRFEKRAPILRRVNAVFISGSLASRFSR
jgi:FkbM family methyltransferase